LVKPGDSPFKIAKNITGDGNRWPELAKANPSKSTRIAQGLIYQGETLNLPPGWPAQAQTAGPSAWGSPDAVAGVMDIIGARHQHHGHHRNGLGAYRHHG
jgi:hypothetical protein